MVIKIKPLTRSKVLLLGLVAGVLVAGPIGAFAIGSGDDTDTSSTQTVVADVDTEAPTVPTEITGSAITTTSITVGWTASTDNVDTAPAYDIRFNGTEINDITSTGYILTNLTPATQYSIEVRARDAAGNTSEYSTQLVVSTSAETTTTTTTPTETTPTETDETPTTDPVTETDLQTAIAIAYAEHEAEVISAKLVYLGDVKAYKIVFADGWRAYVRASDGDIVILKDWFNVTKPIQHKAKQSWMKNHGSWDPHSSAYKAWANGWFKSCNWDGLYGGYNGWYNQDKQTTDPSDATTETTTTTDEATTTTSTPSQTTARSEGGTKNQKQQSNSQHSRTSRR